MGELGLDGSLRSVPGIVPLAASLSAPRVVVPSSCASEAALVAGKKVCATRSVKDLLRALREGTTWDKVVTGSRLPRAPEPDLCDVRGQLVGRRALEVAASGGHHLLLVGPPGSGKTMLARSLVGILPPLGRDEALEVMRVWSAAGVPIPGGSLPERPPFRAPHHNATEVALVGGGTAWLRPGEVSLAHARVRECHLRKAGVGPRSGVRAHPRIGDLRALSPSRRQKC